MASRAFSLSRSLFTARQTLAFIHKAPYSSSVSSVSSPLLSRLSLLRLRPLAAVGQSVCRTYPDTSLYRAFSTRQTQSSLNDSNPNWSNRPPKETILLDGCDFEHWLVVTEKPDENMTRDEIIDMYIETLAKVVGSAEEARMKIYSVSTKHYFAFGALVPEELSYKLKELPNVRWVLPDSYLDVKNKDYGGEPFINGQAVPYDPKYHEEWVRNNAKAMERNRRNDRPRNFDRSRNFERRRQNMQNQTPSIPNQMQNPPPPNMAGGAPLPNMAGGAPPPNMAGGAPPPNMPGGAPPPNMPGGAPPPNMPGGAPYPNMGGPMQTPNNFGGPGPIGGMPPNNMRGPGPNNGVPPNMAGPGSMGGYNPGNSSGPGPNNGVPPNMAGPGSMGGYNPGNSSGPVGGGPPPNTNIGGAGGPSPNTNIGGAGGFNNMGGYSNPGWQGQGGNMPNYQNRDGYPQQQPGPPQNYQGNYGVMGNNGIAGNPHDGNHYQGTRDMPPPNYRQ